MKAVSDSRERVRLGWTDKQQTGWRILEGVTYGDHPETVATPFWAALGTLLAAEPSEFPINAAETLQAARTRLDLLISRAAEVNVSRQPDYDGGKPLSGWHYESAQRYSGIY